MWRLCLRASPYIPNVYLFPFDCRFTCIVCDSIVQWYNNVEWENNHCYHKARSCWKTKFQIIKSNFSSFLRFYGSSSYFADFSNFSRRSSKGILASLLLEFSEKLCQEAWRREESYINHVNNWGEQLRGLAKWQFFNISLI